MVVDEESGEFVMEPVTRIRIIIEKKWVLRGPVAAEPGCITSNAGNWEVSSSYRLRNALRGVVGYVDAVLSPNKLKAQRNEEDIKMALVRKWRVLEAVVR